MPDQSDKELVSESLSKEAELVQADERRVVNSQLQGNLEDAGARPRGGSRGSAPEWLQVATEQEWPHYWVADYTKSVILEVKGDVRCLPLTLTPLSSSCSCLLHSVCCWSNS